MSNQYGTHKCPATQPGFPRHIVQGVFALQLGEDHFLSTTPLVHQFGLGERILAIGDNDLEIEIVTERTGQIRLQWLLSLLCVELAYEQETSPPVLTPGPLKRMAKKYYFFEMPTEQELRETIYYQRIRAIPKEKLANSEKFSSTATTLSIVEIEVSETTAGIHLNKQSAMLATEASLT